MTSAAEVRARQERRKQFLAALYRQSPTGEVPTPIHAIATEIGLAPAETRSIVAALHGDGLIDGLKSDDEFISVMLTNRGRQNVEAALTGPPAPGPAPTSIGDITLGDHSILTVVQNSPGTTVAISPEQLEKVRQWKSDVADALRDVELSDDQRAEVEGLLANLEGELVRPQPDQKSLRERVEEVATWLRTAGGAAAATDGLIEAIRGLFGG